MSSLSQTTTGIDAGPRLTAAIVGCGVIADNHVRALAALGQFDTVALIDPVTPAAERVAGLVELTGQPRPALFADLGEALEAHPVDLVVICTPSGLHVQLAETALKAGSNVVIEKPLDVSVPRARRIRELADEAAERGLVASVISQHRFDPASVVVANAAHSGEFGVLTSAVASVPWWRTQEYYDSGQWRGTWELDGGGAVMNQGVHTVDLMVWFLGKPVAVYAHTARLAHDRIEVEDTAVATVRFENGALAVLHATTAGFPGLPVRVQVHGSNGSAVVEQDQLAYFVSGGAAGDSNADPTRSSTQNRAAELVGPGDLYGTTRPADAFVEGHERQYLDIVDAIRTGRAPGVTVADALLSLAVVRSVYLSATLGREVLVDDVLDGVYDDEPVHTEIVTESVDA
ncbi:Gfo/Idh/MocA family oxidoreductase [Planctomonas sp. JC2975]|uniref:Gfo/Idh/MocA family protein n=1 Tax=Planctomonas sp. JC2975 TaxID=2729626 RepID=UPI0014727FB8|nr:Gfo/Idh/MocA family oxidoreductase [Planctomonas sp. JC2975]NNC11329.1 Gfo/Idh/MocA family oxidoreductase [Planctomonas sp. JC2975]